MAVFSINHLSPPSIHMHLTAFPPRTFPTLQLPRFHAYHLNNLNCNPIFVAPRPVYSATAVNPEVVQHLAASTTLTAGTRSSWAKFAENVSGEWDGFGADFTAEGKPVELPECVVPEAYREWEVRVFDWQTQCPTLAQSDDTHLMYKTIKLLPTVGCEADAATRYTIDERHVTTAAAHPSPIFAYQSSGCYVALWPGTTNQLMELEHCLVDPRDKESRVRIIQVLELGKSDRQLKLQSIRVFVEQWYGPFRNGDQLGGCAVRDSAFAATQPLTASQVSSVWQGHTAVATFSPISPRHGMIQELGDDVPMEKTVRDGDNLVLLPKQLWCSLKRSEEDMETFCEAGWLLGPDHAITSKCTFSSTAELREIAVATETAISV